MESTTQNFSAIRSQTWRGSIPISLSLAPTSLSSPTMPPSQYRMVSRMTYLHIGLREDILRLYNYAPALTILKGKAGTSMAGVDAALAETNKDTNGNNSKSTEISEGKDRESAKKASGSNIEAPFVEKNHYDIPICWFEDEVTGTPLRWQLFTGALYDLLKHKHVALGHKNAINPLPWKIRIHFTNYPSDVLLSLEQRVSPPNKNVETSKVDFDIAELVPIATIIEKNFFNSLKQSLFLQHGTAKDANCISKDSHETLWDAIMKNRCEQFWDESLKFMQTNILRDANRGERANGGEKKPFKHVLKHIPVRMLVNTKPFIQRPCKLEAIENELLEMRKNQIDSKIETNDDYVSALSYFTLGRLLSTWLPSHFSTTSVTNKDQIVSTTYNSITSTWDIQGIRPPLSTPVVDLWLSLCHPDLFLYITVWFDETL